METISGAVPVLTVIPIYAGVLALIYLFLTARTIRTRRSLKIALGTGTVSNRILERAVRAHANFSEYVPMMLLLLAFLEIQKAPEIFLHIAAGVFVIARCIHAYGVSQEPENFRFRVAGMIPTLVLMAVLGVANIYCALV